MPSAAGAPWRSKDAASRAADQRVRWSKPGPLGGAPVASRPDSESGHGSAYRTLARAGGVSIVDVQCRWHAGARYRERFQTYGLSLVRRGVFVRHTRSTDQVGDPTAALFEQPGHERWVSHPLAVPGSTTVIVLSAEAMARYTGDLSMPDRPIPVCPDVHLAHATLLADLRSGIDEAELDARLTWLIGRLVETDVPGRLTSQRAATARSHQRIVDHVREAIAADPAWLDLRGLAAELGHTPFHVSRVFRRATGTTLIQHRNNVRVAVAIDRIAEGHERLAELAAELGFFDQSHLARVLRRSVQLPPGRLRDRLFRGRRPGAIPDNGVQDPGPLAT
jgi:AraC-like DNA-binding protein